MILTVEVPILDRPEERSQFKEMIQLGKTDQVPILDRPEERSQSADRAYLPSHPVFQSSIAPKNDRNDFHMALKLAKAFVPILDRPEERSQFEVLVRGCGFECSNPRSPRRTIAIEGDGDESGE